MLPDESEIINLRTMCSPPGTPVDPASYFAFLAVARLADATLLSGAAARRRSILPLTEAVEGQAVLWPAYSLRCRRRGANETLAIGVVAKGEPPLVAAGSDVMQGTGTPTRLAGAVP